MGRFGQSGRAACISDRCIIIAGYLALLGFLGEPQCLENDNANRSFQNTGKLFRGRPGFAQQEKCHRSFSPIGHFQLSARFFIESISSTARDDGLFDPRSKTQPSCPSDCYSQKPKNHSERYDFSSFVELCIWKRQRGELELWGSSRDTKMTR